MPGAREFRAARRAHLVDRRQVARGPVAQRLGVVQAQVLHVEHAEGARLEDRHHLAERGRLRAREDAPLDPAVHRLGAVAADGMDEAQSLRREAAVDDLAERAVVLRADVLEHADRNERRRTRRACCGSRPRCSSTRPARPSRARPLGRVADLLARNVPGAHLDAVVARHVQREAAPAATRLEHALAGPQPQLAADVVHLGALRGLQRHAGLGEIGAGVLHRLAVEPGGVEVVAEVVVPVDVVVRGRQRRDAAPGRPTAATRPNHWRARPASSAA